MITVYIYTFLSVLAVSMISLAGVFTLSLKEELLRKYIFFFISVAVGALLGDSFIHLIPEAFESSSNSALVGALIIGGIFGFFIIEKFLHWHHHGEDKTHEHIHPVGKLVLFSDGVHNLIDGFIIAASFTIDIPLGIATTLAVILHEIPQEVGDFAVLLHAGYPKSRALWLNFLSAITSFLGAVIFFFIGEFYGSLAAWMIPLSAGGFIYIAIADLIPELHKTTRLKYTLMQFFGIGLGVFAMIMLTLLE